MLVETARKTADDFVTCVFLQKNGAWRTCLLKTVAKSQRWCANEHGPQFPTDHWWGHPWHWKIPCWDERRLIPFHTCGNQIVCFRTWRFNQYLSYTYGNLRVVWFNQWLVGWQCHKEQHTPFLLVKNYRYTCIYLYILGMGCGQTCARKENMWIGLFCNIDPQKLPLLRGT